MFKASLITVASSMCKFGLHELELLHNLLKARPAGKVAPPGHASATAARIASRTTTMLMLGKYALVRTLGRK